MSDCLWAEISFIACFPQAVIQVGVFSAFDKVGAEQTDCFEDLFVDQHVSGGRHTFAVVHLAHHTFGTPECYTNPTTQISFLTGVKFQFDRSPDALHIMFVSRF